MNTLPFEVTESVLSYLTLESDFRKLKLLSWRLARLWISSIDYLDFRNGESYYNGDYTLKACPQALPAEKVLQLADRCPRVRMVSLPPLRVTLPNPDLTSRILRDPRYRDIYLLIDHQHHTDLLTLREGIRPRQIYNGQFSYNWLALKLPTSKYFIYDYGSLDESPERRENMLISDSIVHTIINPVGDRETDRVIINSNFLVRWKFDTWYLMSNLAASIKSLEIRISQADIVYSSIYLGKETFSNLLRDELVFSHLETLTLPIDMEIGREYLQVPFPKVKNFVAYQHLLSKHRLEQAEEMRLMIEKLRRSIQLHSPGWELDTLH